MRTRHPELVRPSRDLGEDLAVVRADHLQQEKIEPKSAHVFGLMLVSAEPCECEFAHTCSKLFEQRLELLRARIAMFFAPLIHVT